MVGLTPADVRAKISSRKLLALVLREIGIDESRLDAMYALLDKKAKLPAETFDAMLAEQVADTEQARRIGEFMALDSVEQLDRVVTPDDEIRAATEQMQSVFATLELMGVADYCVFDPSIVRGLAYYTGVVFEIHDIVGELRAICGGGRYDNLLRDFGGPSIPATGMGMGDCVLEILLHQKGLLDSQVPPRRLEFFVACADGALARAMYSVAAKLRAVGRSANFSYKLGGLSKQLKEASSQNASYCVILGQEYLDRRELAVKDMTSGEQRQVGADRFLSELAET
jgi:histidyl-tRNA synthetase